MTDGPDQNPPQSAGHTLLSLGPAAYALLILAMAALGLVCAGTTLTAQLTAQNTPNKLTSGFELDPWRLQELRKWEVLPPGTTPQLYHDHTPFSDGTAGCAVIEGSLMLWQDKVQIATIDLHGAQVELTTQDDSHVVTVRADDERIDCPFGPNEGGERFHRMLEAESLLPQ
jgi:hypothetical protein